MNVIYKQYNERKIQSKVPLTGNNFIKLNKCYNLTK